MISIQLERSAFKPGDEIKGEVYLEEPTGEDTLEVGIVWHTEGRGDEDIGVAESLTFSLRGGERRYSFRFILPESPYSYSGKLISIHWNLEANLGSKHAAESFVLSPTGNVVTL